MGESTVDTGRLRAAALFSVGAGVVHGAAVGIHAGHPALVRKIRFAVALPETAP